MSTPSHCRPRRRSQVTVVRRAIVGIGITALALPVAVQAQDSDGGTRTRIAVGAQAGPSYPGANGVSLRPFGAIARASDDQPFDVATPDGTTEPTLLHRDGLSIGPSVAFQGSRSRSDTDGKLARVGSTVEIGGFASYQVASSFRLNAEVRRGVSGHRAWIGTLGADYMMRDGDRSSFSFGPRVTFTDAKFSRTYFGVAPDEASASGLAAYRPGGGLESVGVNLGLYHVIAGPFGVYGYARYDRLVDDAGRSPVVAAFGSRDQASGGLALSYTFGHRRR